MYFGGFNGHVGRHINAFDAVIQVFGLNVNFFLFMLLECSLCIEIYANHLVYKGELEHEGQCHGGGFKGNEREIC